MGKKWFLFLQLAAASLLGACTSGTHEVAQEVPPTSILFQSPNSTARVPKALLAEFPDYTALLDSPISKQAWSVQANPSVIDKSSASLSVALPDVGLVKFDLKKFSETAGMYGWVGDVASDRKQRFSSSGEVDFSPTAWISVTYNKQSGRLVGDVHYEGTAYRLESVARERYVLVKLDESKLPRDEEILANPSESEVGADTDQLPKTAMSIIRVLMVTSTWVRKNDPNYREGLVNAIQNANLYMRNSQVGIVYELADVYDADYDSDAELSAGTHLGDLRSTGNSMGASVATLRNAVRADLVSLYSRFSNYSSLGGVAYVNAVKSTAFSVFGYYGVMAHELGHNVGASHNWEQGQPEGNPTYSYGYRYSEGPKFYTQMSYPCSGCRLVPYHSNPRLRYENVALGTERNHDVARRFNERRETVENFYPPALNMKLLGSIKSCELAHGLGSKTNIATECNYFANKKVVTIRIFNVPEGTRLLFTEGDNKWRSYLAKAFIPELLVTPLLGRPGDYPNMDIEEGSEPMTGMLTTISSSTAR